MYILFTEKPSVVKIIDVNHNKFVCTVELVHPPPTFHWRYREYFDCNSKEKCLYQWKSVNASAPDFEVTLILMDILEGYLYQWKFLLRDHSFTKCAKFFKKLTLLTYHRARNISFLENFAYVLKE